MSDSKKTLLEEALRRNYPIELHHVAEDGGYWLAFHPDFGFSACSATGDSEEETLSLLGEVKAAVIQHYIEIGKALPEPSASPAD